MASERVVDDIKQRLDLVEYINRSVDLKRAGRTYKACCPFHTEKTPSFVVFPHTNTWHCFGACGEGGDIFSYVQKREGLSFTEVLQLLAREAGIQLEEEGEREQQARAERERLFDLCEAAMHQYQQWLHELPDAEHCRAYLERRALSPETVHRFGLGYAPNDWEALLRALGGRGYQPADLALVGLLRERDAGGYYDTLRDRLVFPIRDVRGRVIGFGGRALHDEQVPKYINSPQTPLFDKSRTLYAIDLAKDTIRTQECAVIVEGYMDAIAAHQAGYGNVVASLGTALTVDQLRLLSRYSPNLVLALDADSAGQKAAERGLETVMELQRTARRARYERARQGLGKAGDIEGELRVLTLPEGYDPDDLLREAPDRWQKLVTEAKPVVDYMIDRHTRGLAPEDAVGKARATSELLPIIAEIDSAVIRDHYLQRLARLLRLDERTLAQELVKQLGKRKRERKEISRQGTPLGPVPPPTSFDDPLLDEPPPDEEQREGAPSGASIIDAGGQPGTEAQVEPRTLEAYLLHLVLEHPPLLQTARDYGVLPAMWEQPEYRQFFELLLRSEFKSRDELEELLDEADPLVARQIRRLVSYYTEQPNIAKDEWDDEAFGRLISFLIQYDERQARHLHYVIDDLQRTSEADLQMLRQLLQQKTAVEQRALKHQRLLRERSKRRKPASVNRA